jgi:hypothetical protein
MSSPSLRERIQFVLVLGAQMSDDPNYNPIRNVILPDAKKQPDRSLAIVLAAVVEDQLGEMLQAKVVDDKQTVRKMFSGMGPLATFSAQIDLGFLLGFYGDEMHSLLHAIRVVRNITPTR